MDDAGHVSDLLPDCYVGCRDCDSGLYGSDRVFTLEENRSTSGCRLYRSSSRNRSRIELHVQRRWHCRAEPGEGISLYGTGISGYSIFLPAYDCDLPDLFLCDIYCFSQRKVCGSGIRAAGGAELRTEKDAGPSSDRGSRNYNSELCGGINREFRNTHAGRTPGCRICYDDWRLCSLGTESGR